MEGDDIMSFKKTKKLKYISILTGLLIVIGTSAYAIQNNIISDNSVSTDKVNEKSQLSTSSAKLEEFRKKVAERENETLAKELGKQYSKSEEEIRKMKSELGNWKDVSVKLMQDKKSLTKEKILELRDEGYSLSDIDEAERLALMCDKTPEEILAVKGKTSDYDQKVDNDGKGTNNAAVDNSKSWDEVIQILKIETRTPAEKAGVSKARVEELKKNGVSEDEINKAAVLVQNYKKDFDEVLNEIKKGKKFEELDDQYNKEKMDTPQYKALHEKKLLEAEENLLKKNYKVTDDMINKCHNYGIKGIDIIVIKKLIDKHNLPVEQVLKLYSQKKDLKLLVQEMGGV
jgi:hypothetical protein